MFVLTSGAGSGITIENSGAISAGLGGEIIDGDIVEQFEQALGNLLTALAAAGGEPDHLTSVTVYIVDMAAYRERARDIGEVWKRLVGRDYPAMAGIGVARLWDDAALVELQGSAALP